MTKIFKTHFHETLATYRNILKINYAWEERASLFIRIELWHRIMSFILFYVKRIYELLQLIIIVLVLPTRVHLDPY